MRLNVGSGQRPFKPPFVNVDCQAKWNPDIVASGDNMPMFKDESADVIVLHHVYEHFGLGDADKLVQECYRILEPGGSLIVTVPDLYELVKAWIHRKIDDYIFCINIYGAYMGDEADRHKWAYTERTLSEALGKAAVWKEVRMFNWRQIEGADIAKDWWILGVEAIK